MTDEPVNTFDMFFEEFTALANRSAASGAIHRGDGTIEHWRTLPDGTIERWKTGGGWNGLQAAIDEYKDNPTAETQDAMTAAAKEVWPDGIILEGGRIDGASLDPNGLGWVRWSVDNTGTTIRRHRPRRTVRSLGHRQLRLNFYDRRDWGRTIRLLQRAKPVRGWQLKARSRRSLARAVEQGRFVRHDGGMLDLGVIPGANDGDDERDPVLFAPGTFTRMEGAIDLFALTPAVDTPEPEPWPAEFPQAERGKIAFLPIEGPADA